jgi:hypothetical protein
MQSSANRVKLPQHILVVSHSMEVIPLGKLDSPSGHVPKASLAEAMGLGAFHPAHAPLRHLWRRDVLPEGLPCLHLVTLNQNGGSASTHVCYIISFPLNEIALDSALFA